MSELFTIDDVLKKYKKYRRKDVRFLMDKGVINNPITAEDMILLGRLHKIWRNENFIRLLLSGKKKSEIRQIMDYLSADCETKLDVWLYSYIKNKMELGEKIYKSKIVDDALRIFKLKGTRKSINEIEKRVKKIKSKIKKQIANR
ncbi:MAG: hypothetical protein HPY60_11295 [Candidatus Methanofastidiosum sp.]|nr:hypothetical protein [Methanofastidiosum sp.]